MRILALDLGTTNCKAAIFDHGRVQARYTERLETHRASPGSAEQHPANWRDVTTRLVRKLVAEAGDFDAVGLSAQSDSLVLVDQDGNDVRPAILWMDRRGEEEASQLAKDVGVEAVHAVTGLRPASTFTAAKAAWVQRHEPEVFSASRWIMQPKDYLFRWLTGEVLTDPSSASRTLLFDQAQDRWSAQLLEAFGFRKQMLPPIASDSSVTRPLAPAAAEALGVRSGIPVAIGASDRAAEALGLGVDATRALLSTGTATGLAVTTPSTAPLADSRLIAPRHAIRNERLLLGGIPTSGVIIEWVAGLGGSRHPGVAQVLREAQASPLGAGGVVCAVSFAGARSIRWSPDARGAFLGVGLATSRGDLARAVVEAIGLELVAILDVMATAGSMPEELVLTGGLHRSRFVCQTMSDIIGLPATRVGERDAALAGAMLLAQHALEPVTDLRAEARARQTRPTTFAPDSVRHDRYRQLAPRYEAAIADIISWGSSR